MIRDILSLDARYRQIRNDFVMGKIIGADFVVESNDKKIPALMKKPEEPKSKNKNASS